MKIPKLKKGKEIFIPGCVTREDGIIECSPKLIKQDVTLESERPIRLRKVDVEGQPAMEILDDGGAQAELIDMLRKYVAKRHL